MSVASTAPTTPARAIAVAPAARLRGEVLVPGDKSISHRALMLALLARGESRVDGAGDGADVRSTARVAAALGATVERTARTAGRADYRVVSPGANGLRAPDGVLDCGNSGTTLRLFAGILAGLPFRAVLDGDASLRGRPMARVVEPLRAMGASVEGPDGASRAPLTVLGPDRLRAIDWTTPVPSAQVKSAILLAGLRADGTTRVHEAVATRDHTERMLRARGVAVRTRAEADGSMTIEIDGGQPMQTIDQRVPGDPSAAAFWLVAGAIHPDADLTLPGVGINPTRRAAIDLLRSMGAAIDEAVVDGQDGGEPTADLRVRSSELRGVDLGPADVAAAIDEVPILCLAATQAVGRTTIRGAGELRHKESDRLAGIAAGLAALGARVSIDGDDLTIDGPTPLLGALPDGLGDHRLIMTFAIAGLVARGRMTIAEPSGADISYPGFFTDLERIRA